jgi:hypothetical protein
VRTRINAPAAWVWEQVKRLSALVYIASLDEAACQVVSRMRVGFIRQGGRRKEVVTWAVQATYASISNLFHEHFRGL